MSDARVVVPAGKCDSCDEYVERLWITMRYGLYCADCITFTSDDDAPPN